MGCDPSPCIPKVKYFDMCQSLLQVWECACIQGCLMYAMLWDDDGFSEKLGHTVK